MKVSQALTQPFRFRPAFDIQPGNISIILPVDFTFNISTNGSGEVQAFVMNADSRCVAQASEGCCQPACVACDSHATRIRSPCSLSMGVKIGTNSLMQVRVGVAVWCICCVFGTSVSVLSRPFRRPFSPT